MSDGASAGAPKGKFSALRAAVNSAQPKPQSKGGLFGLADALAAHPASAGPRRVTDIRTIAGRAKSAKPVSEPSKLNVFPNFGQSHGEHPRWVLKVSAGNEKHRQEVLQVVDRTLVSSVKKASPITHGEGVAPALNIDQVRGSVGSHYDNDIVKVLERGQQLSIGAALPDQRSIKRLTEKGGMFEAAPLSIGEGTVTNIMDATIDLPQPEWEKKLSHYRAELVRTVREESPQLSNFVLDIVRKYDALFDRARQSQNLTGVRLFHDALSRSQKDAVELKKEVDELRTENSQLEHLVRQLKDANRDYASHQTELEKYTTAIRAALCNVCNRVLSGDQGRLRPDGPTPEPYIAAVKTLALEVEHLRESNMHLLHKNEDQNRTYTSQVSEASAILDRANDFQQTIGGLKATIRVMKKRIDELEMEKVNLLAISDEKLRLQALLERNKTVTAVKVRGGLVCSGLHRLVAEKKGLLAADVAVPEISTLDSAFTNVLSPHKISEGTMPSLGTSSKVPNHLRTSADIIALREMPYTEIKNIVEDVFRQKQAAEMTMPISGKQPMSQFFASYMRKVYGNEKSGAEASYSFVLSADKHRFVDPFVDQMLLLLSGDAPVTIHEEVENVLGNMTQHLQSMSGKKKEKVPISDFIFVTKTFLPFMTACDEASLAVLVTASVEKASTTDVNYKNLLDASSPQRFVGHFIRYCLIQEQLSRFNAITEAMLEDCRNNVMYIEKGECPASSFVIANMTVDPQCTQQGLQERLVIGSGDAMSFMHSIDQSVVLDANGFLHNLKRRCVLFPMISAQASTPRSTKKPV